MIFFDVGLICLMHLISVCVPLQITCERAHMVYYNPKLFSNGDVTCYPYNRTLRMLNVTLNFARQPGANDYMDFKVYVFSSNRYVLTGIQTTIRWKDLVKYPYFGIKKILLLNTIPSFDKWPIPAGEYKMFNIAIPANEIPLNMPLGNYMAAIKHIDNHEIMLVWQYYMKIN